MSRFRSSGWRVVGSVTAWLLFSFSFAGLFQVAAVVSGLGGFCATGGPYVIETECPDSVVVFSLIAVPGMLIACGIALFFADGFGMPLLAWAWPVLFVGLGIQFLLSMTPDVGGIIMGVLLGGLFIVMGAVPLLFVLRTNPRQAFVGNRNLLGQRFEHAERPSSVLRPTFAVRPPDEDVVAVRRRDWLIALVLAGAPIAAGTWLALLAFNGIAAAAA